MANDIIKSKHIDWAATGGGDTGGIWWEELGRTTLGSAGDTITVSGLPARKYLKIICYTLATGGTIINGLRFNNDSGNNYTTRFQDNGTESSNNTQSSGLFRPGAIVSGGVGIAEAHEIINIATVAKITRFYTTGEVAGTGASNPLARLEGAIKWVNTSDLISRVDVVNLSGTGDFAIGSEVIVLGHN